MYRGSPASPVHPRSPPRVFRSAVGGPAWKRKYTLGSKHPRCQQLSVWCKPIPRIRHPTLVMATLAPLLENTLVVVAHSDDETIGCGCLMQRMNKVRVAFATDGAPLDPQFWPKYHD